MRIRKSLGTLVLPVAAALAFAAPAQAASCGNAAPYLRNVKVANVSCAGGKAVARAVWRRQSTCIPRDDGHTRTARCRFSGWTCASRRLSRAPSFAVLCVRSRMRVAFLLTY